MTRLTKISTLELVAPAQPGVSSRAAVPFWMFATPPPQGWSYRQGNNSSPNNEASFLSWSQVHQPPLEYATRETGIRYLTLAQMDAEFGKGASSYMLPSGASMVYATVGNEVRLVGYTVPVYSSVALPPRWWGPINYMSYVYFPDVETAANGYPLSRNPVVGRFEIWTASGSKTIERTYVKDSRGFWVPTGYTDTDGCRTYGSAKVCMVLNQPGVARREPKNAEYRKNPNLGWNAEAFSQAENTGNLKLEYVTGAVVGTIVGLQRVAPHTNAPPNLNAITHGLHVAASGAGVVVRVIELGVYRTPPMGASATARMQITRTDGVVRYIVGGTEIYRSMTPSYGAQHVHALMFSAGDSVG